MRQDRGVVDERATYGVDAPGVLFGMTVGGLVELTVAVALFIIGWAIPAIVLLVGGLGLAVSAAVFAHTTFRGKFRVWDEELDALRLAGDERVLDLGCGRGLVLLKAARRVPNGKVTGIDLWSGRDQLGNTEDATLANACAEGVADRVELVTGDMRELPFESGTFDLVVSSLAVHNIPDAEGRARAIAEALRVLKPGGRLRVADFRYAKAYGEVLREWGAADVHTRDLGWRFWYGGPHARTTMLTATAPA
ncbi:class I SAM-dependent methyltransferase [Streptosporangiaceae bacterium NEAU-GS5]|nr:class I SAM-dependent methyltransferase [Streptosporangiaceae bacterium NEAU-GS5]